MTKKTKMHGIPMTDAMHNFFLKAGKELMSSHFVGDIKPAIEKIWNTMKNWRCPNCKSYQPSGFTPVIVNQVEGFQFRCGCNWKGFFPAKVIIQKAFGYPQYGELQGIPSYHKTDQRIILQMIEEQTAGLKDEEKFKKIEKIISEYEPEPIPYLTLNGLDDPEEVFPEHLMTIDLRDEEGNPLPTDHMFSPGDKLVLNVQSKMGKDEEPMKIPGLDYQRTIIDQVVNNSFARSDERMQSKVKSWELKLAEHNKKFVHLLIKEISYKEIHIEELSKENKNLKQAVEKLKINQMNDSTARGIQEQNRILMELRKENEELKKELSKYKPQK